MNFFIVHKASNLIANVVSSSKHPEQSTDYRAYRARSKDLNKYYRKLAKSNGLLDIYDVLVKPKKPTDPYMGRSEREAMVQDVKAKMKTYTLLKLAHDWNVSLAVIEGIARSVSNKG